MAGHKAKYIPALRFHWLTPVYDAVLHISMRENTFKKRLVDLAHIQPGQTVLDLGCGTGTLSILIKQAHPKVKVVGLDGDGAVLDRAASKARRAKADVTFGRGLSFELPYPPDSFQKVVSTLFFHHLCSEDKKRTLEEVYRVLAPQGELHLCDWGTPSNALMRASVFLVQVLDGFDVTSDNLKGRLPQIMERAGFDHVEQTGALNTFFGTLAYYKGRKE